MLHTAEGKRTYQDQGRSSRRPGQRGGIDDTTNTVGEYVQRSGKAWTAAAANPYSIQAELCAFAEWGSLEWQSHPQMLANTAQWIAEEARYFGIPIVRLTSSQAQDGYSRGVCQHVNLGSAGGGHWDCGPSFPMDDVLAMATGGAPSSTPQEDDMIITEPDGEQLQLIYGGKDSYWRTLPANAAARIPDGMKIKDDGSLKSLWKVGSK